MNPNPSEGPASRHAAEIALLETVGRDLRGADLPLELTGVETARAGIAGTLAQLENYLLPRLRSLDAPLLAVVGGSTGAGKSTLVNALAGRPVTRAGAVRPTTRRPVLLHHPDDAGWFEDRRILPGLSRSTGDPAEAGAATSLTVVPEQSVPSGIALLDTPDIDSVADENRRLAGELLDAADLWIFVTTANRYADAVPWALLLDAASRDILVAVVLDRVPADAEDEVTADLEAMLRAHGLAAALLFVIPETRLDDARMLPALLVEPLRRWLAGIAFDTASRAEVARRTLSGAVKALAVKVDAAAQAAHDQHVAVRQLRSAAEEPYRRAAQRVMDSAQDGTPLRGEVLARWQDFVGTGEFFRALEQNVGRMRDRIGAFLRGQPAPAVRVEHAIESGLQAVIVAEAGNAAEEADRRWRSEPAGRLLLVGDDLSGPGAEFEQAAAAAIRDWQRALLAMIQAEGSDRRLQARMLSFGVNGAGVALMVVVFSMTGGLTGLELGIAGGSAVIGQKLLEAVFGEDAVRRLARRAREDLASRCEALFAAECARFTDRLDGLAPAQAAADLRDHAQSLLRLGQLS